MKTASTPHRRALAALLPTLMLATPALAQEVPATPAPAPVVQAAPPMAPSVAPSLTVPQAVPDPVATQTVTPPPVVLTVANPAAPLATRAPVARRAVARPTAPRAVVRPAPAPVAIAPAPAPVTAPAPAATAPVAAPAPAPRAPSADPIVTSTRSTATTDTAPAIWPWVVGAVLVLGALLALLLRRRRRHEDIVETHSVYDEPVMTGPSSAEPTLIPTAAVAAPVIATTPALLRPPLAPAEISQVEPGPMQADHTEIVDADPAEVDALTAGTPPVADRPWIEFAMRPIRAGTQADEAVVEIELTVGNAGSVAARDVRIATFLFASAPADDAALERLLIEQGDAGRSEPIDIAAGEGTRIDATLALPRGALGETFNPVVVADARYRLADGTEGRTCASFAIGLTGDGDGFAPIENTQREMHHDVEARLEGLPEHA